MSPYSRMRDPLENRELAFFLDPSEPAPDDEQFLADLSWHIERVRNRMFLLCLTHDAKSGYRASDLPFLRAWARARMWEQYAANHTGVCLAFDANRVLEHVSDNLRQRGMFFAGDVAYTPRGFAGTPAASLRPSDFGGTPHNFPKIGEFVLANEEAIFRTKTLDWEGEHELRLIFSPRVARGAPDVSDEYVFVPVGDAKSVRAVILGENFPEWQLPAARWACKQVGVPLVRLQWRAGLPWPMPAGDDG